MIRKIVSFSTIMLSIALMAVFIGTENIDHSQHAFAAPTTTQAENKPLEQTQQGITLALSTPQTVYATKLTPIEVKATDSNSGQPISHIDWAISVKDPEGNVLYKTTTAHSHAGTMNFNVGFTMAGEHTISLTSSSIGPKMMGMDVPAKARTHTMLSGSLMGFESDPFNNFGSRTFDFPVYVLSQKQIRTVSGSEPGSQMNVELSTTSDKIIAGEPTTLILTTTNANGEDPMTTHVDALIKVRKGHYVASDSAERGSEMMPMNGAYHGHLGQISFTTTFPDSGNYLVTTELNSLGVSKVQFGMAKTSFNVIVAEANGEASHVKSEIIPGKVDVLGLESPFYSPNNISVKAGETVTFDNIDANFHTITSGNAQNGPDGKFDSGLLSAGEKFTVTLDTPGTYNYYCTIHPNMVGTVTVS